MSDGHGIIQRPPERHELTLRPAGAGDAPDLLRQIVEDVKKLVPTGTKALGRYVEAKGEEAVARVQEIKARVYENIGKLEIERQRLIQQRDEVVNAHAAKMKELEIQRLRERTQTLREVVECIVKLRGSGIPVQLKVVRKAGKAMTELLEAEGL